MKNKAAITALTVISALTPHFAQAHEERPEVHVYEKTDTSFLVRLNNDWLSQRNYFNGKTRTVDIYVRAYHQKVGESDRLAKNNLLAAEPRDRVIIHCDSGIVTARPALLLSSTEVHEGKTFIAEPGDICESLAFGPS